MQLVTTREEVTERIENYIDVYLNEYQRVIKNHGTPGTVFISQHKWKGFFSLMFHVQVGEREYHTLVWAEGDVCHTNSIMVVGPLRWVDGHKDIPLYIQLSIIRALDVMEGKLKPSSGIPCRGTPMDVHKKVLQRLKTSGIAERTKEPPRAYTIDIIGAMVDMPGRIPLPNRVRCTLSVFGRDVDIVDNEITVRRVNKIARVCNGAIMSAIETEGHHINRMVVIGHNISLDVVFICMQSSLCFGCGVKQRAREFVMVNNVTEHVIAIGNVRRVDWEWLSDEHLLEQLMSDLVGVCRDDPDRKGVASEMQNACAMIVKHPMILFEINDWEPVMGNKNNSK